MAKFLWHQAVKIMMKNVVKVTTLGGGYGSGVIVPTPKNAPGNCCVLTAYHVVANAFVSGATLEIEMALSHEKIRVASLTRNIFIAKERDQALIIFSLPSPTCFGEPNSYAMLEQDKHYIQGVELGWLGYPCLEVAKDNVCFLHGWVSAYLEKEESYLVDGSSIHGVSGGPVFCCDDAGSVVLAGIVTNYFPNEVGNQYTGKQAWPGLAMFRTINPLMKLYAQSEKQSQPLIPTTATSLNEAD